MTIYEVAADGELVGAHGEFDGAPTLRWWYRDAASGVEGRYRWRQCGVELTRCDSDWRAPITFLMSGTKRRMCSHCIRLANEYGGSRYR